MVQAFGTIKWRFLVLGRFFVLGWLFLSLFSYSSAQNIALDQTEILGRLAAGNTASYVAHLIKTRGVGFSVSEDFLYRVKLAGGAGILAERILSAEQSRQPQSLSGREPSFEHLARCAQLIHVGATDLAEKACRASIEENPKSPWPLLAMARLLQNYDLTGTQDETYRENREERKELLRRAVALGPDSALARQLLSTTSDPRDAAAELEKASRSDEEQLEISETTLQEIPRVAYIDGDEDSPEPTASSNEPARVDPATARHIEIEPELATNHRKLALLYLQVGNFDKVESEFAEAIRLEPDNLSIRSDLAVYYLSRRNADAGIAELHEATRIAPLGIAQHIFLADTLKSLGRTGEALNELQDLTAMYPASMAASESLVELYLEKKDLNCAIAELRRSLKASSLAYSDQGTFVESHYQDLNRLAQMLKESRELDAAAEQYLFLLRYLPNSASLHNDYGSVLLDQGEKDQAIGEYNEAIRLDLNTSNR